MPIFRRYKKYTRPRRPRRSFVKTGVRNTRILSKYTGTTHKARRNIDNRNWGRFLLYNPLPPIMWREMTFSRSGSLSTVGSSALFSATPQSFYLNSVYHCDGSNNADGYTMMVTQYRRFKVVSVDLYVEFFSPSGENVYGGAWVKGPDSGTDISALEVRTATDLPSCAVAPVPDSGSQKCEFKATFNIADIIGVTKQQFMYDWNYSAVSGGSASKVNVIPDVKCIVDLGVATGNASAQQTCSYRIKLVYKTQWFGRAENLAN